MPANALYRDGSPPAAFTGATLFRRTALLGVAALLTVFTGCAAVHHEVARNSRRPIGATAFTTRRPDPFPPVPGVVHRSDDDDPPSPSRTYLLLRLRERRLYMVTYDLGAGVPAEIESFPVAIGRKEYETPTGVFAVTDKVADPDWVQFDWNDPSKKATRIVPPGPDNPLGRRWIGFASGYGWQIGFHGTPHPELLGKAVSHGCVRMRNDDVVKIYDHVRVGTVVLVQP